MSLSCLLKIKKYDEIYLFGDNVVIIAGEDCPSLPKNGADIKLHTNYGYIYIGTEWVAGFQKIVKKGIK